jgi:hypothetical protein
MQSLFKLKLIVRFCVLFFESGDDHAAWVSIGKICRFLRKNLAKLTALLKFFPKPPMQVKRSL